MNGLSLAYMVQFAPEPAAMLAYACDKLAAWYGPNRHKWLGASSDACIPAHLTDQLPGDYS